MSRYMSSKRLWLRLLCNVLLATAPQSHFHEHFVLFQSSLNTNCNCLLFFFSSQTIQFNVLHLVAPFVNPIGADWEADCESVSIPLTPTSLALIRLLAELRPFPGALFIAASLPIDPLLFELIPLPPPELPVKPPVRRPCLAAACIAC
uniref:Secreted protein n=1 Tax=Glossina pallidipes TaxID=7398 RepID=A0A1A9ZK27_GLOPL